jgi:hypothetical protein
MAVLAVTGLAAYLFPSATAKAPSAVLSLLAPDIGQEFKRVEKMHREVAATFPNATAAPRETNRGN